MRNLLTVFLLLIGANLMKAQDTIQMLNGKYKLVEIVDNDYDYAYYKKVRKSGKLGRKRRVNLDRVFAISYQDSVVRHIYRQDSLFDNFWTVNEMQYYLEGRRQARKHFRPYKTFLIGVAVGTGVAMYSLFPPVIEEKDRSTSIIDTVTNSVVTVNYKDPVALTIPFPYWEVIPLSAYVYFAGKYTNEKGFKADKQELFQNKEFVMGYRETVVDRQIYTAIGSSFGSFLATMGAYMLLDPVED